MSRGFLPISRKDMEERGIDQLDFVYVSGDAYVDHPSFGTAIITRMLEANGFSVGIIAQPDWKDDASIAILGKPRLGFLVSAGNMDSMVNHYAVSKKRRKTDAYTPGGLMGKRPDRAVIVYGNLIRRTYKDVPVIIGGIEASLRRLAHYDYWEDRIRRSVLLDSGADLLSYGMGEHSILEIAQALDAGIAVRDITFVRGTVFRAKSLENVYDYELLPSYEELLEDRTAYARSFGIQYKNTDPHSGRRLAEPYPDGIYVVQNPAAEPLTRQEMDDIYAYPYMRAWHPSYEAAGGVPAAQEIQFSLVSCRGCFGACNFCALTFHQGRIIQSRSQESILAEARLLTEEKDFKGNINVVGGPTANFRVPACKKQETKGACRDRQCLFPKPCPNLRADHSDYLELLQRLRALPGIKKVFVRSGIRFDYLLCDKDDRFFRELVKYHISGQLKVAPEHVSDRVLACMGKPPHRVYQEFAKKYQRLNREEGMNQYLVPYLMSSHPGCTMKDAVELACYLHSIGHMPEQVQDFYPTPSTVSTCMYYTGLDPRTMEKVYVPRDPHEKAMQRALMQYCRPENRALVEEALRAAGREDLIGYGKECLIRPAGKKTRVSGYRAGRNAGVSASGRGEYRGTGGSGEGRKGAGVRFFENREQTGERFREDRERTEERFRKDRERRGERMGGSGGASGKKTIRNIHKKKRR